MITITLLHEIKGNGELARISDLPQTTQGANIEAAFEPSLAFLSFFFVLFVVVIVPEKTCTAGGFTHVRLNLLVHQGAGLILWTLHLFLK